MSNIDLFERLYDQTPLTIEFGPNVNAETMVETILGRDISYYSVFNQFQEPEFQVMQEFYDEWYQVYRNDEESEPWFNIYILGDKMLIKAF